MGKEGPMVHTGACIANLLGQGGSRKYHLTWKWLRYFKNDRDRRDLITCGAAAGVAAAFRAPVGGVLFALEEAASWFLSFTLYQSALKRLVYIGESVCIYVCLCIYGRMLDFSLVLITCNGLIMGRRVLVAIDVQQIGKWVYIVKYKSKSGTICWMQLVNGYAEVPKMINYKNALSY